MAANIERRLAEHLTALQSQPLLGLDTRLVDEAALVLPDQLAPEVTYSYVKQISAILQTIQEDPTPLTQLLEKLLRAFSFSDVITFEPPIDFTAGLQPVPALVPVNLLMLSLLQKATSPTDVATVAGWPEVVKALIQLWLRSEDTGVAARADSLIQSYLSIDMPSTSTSAQQLPDTSTGHRLMWKRLFADPTVYASFYVSCDLASAGAELSKRQITLAQARLLEALPSWIKLDWSAISKSHFSEVEAAHGVKDGGLLDFASLRMVDVKDDVLLHVCLLDFFAKLLMATKNDISSGNSSEGLDYLIKAGIHEQVSQLYLSEDTEDPLESMFFYGPASRYLATYASQYTQHYMSSNLPISVHRNLYSKFDQSASRWSHGEPPKYDLSLLASLPRISLLPVVSQPRGWTTSPVVRIPSASAPPDVYDALAVMFHGPAEEVITFPQASPMSDVDHKYRVDDAAAARTLYFQYLAHHRTLWKDVVAAAETVAILDRALAALNLLRAVITANWSAEREFDLPSDVIATPETGVMAILSPPALEYVIPYLNRPAQTFSNLVGGRGDAESSAYKIAVSKYDTLRALHSRLSAFLERTPDLDLQAVLTTLGKRLADGPLATEGEVGGRIATLDL